jgi:hypothetical protein
VADPGVAVRLSGVTKRFGDGPVVIDDISLTVGARRVRLPARRLRLRQVDAAQPGRRASTRRPPARSTVPGGRAR